jgi:predicted phosphodiesterase
MQYDYSFSLNKHKDIIQRYSEKYPYLSITKLANLIINEEKIDHSIETFRKVISAYRIKNNTPNDIILEDDNFELPESWYEETPIFEVPKSCQSILVLNDIHIPYHSNEALQMALKWGKNRGIDTIYLNGDIMDFASLSFFRKTIKDMDFSQEISICRKFLANLRSWFPDCKIFFKAGNHEIRLETYIMNRAIEMSSDPELKINEKLRLKEFGMEYIEGTQIARINNLYILHGHELRSSYGVVNLSRTLLLKTFVNLIFGHFHQRQYYEISKLDGDVFGAWSVGCLSGLKPLYSPINQWVHGFAHIEVIDGKKFHVENKLIKGNMIL